MTDEKYIFVTDAAEKKKTARAIRNTNRTGKGPIRFPSDYMTKKERDAMNGEVATYNLRRPMKWKDFKAMPEDLRRDYLRYIDDTFNPSAATLCDMFGVSTASIVRERQYLGVKNPYGRKVARGWNPDAWEEWLTPPTPAPMPSVEETEPTHESVLAVVPEEPFSVSGGEFTLIATPAELAQLLTVIGGAERRNYCVKFW